MVRAIRLGSCPFMPLLTSRNECKLPVRKIGHIVYMSNF